MYPDVKFGSRKVAKLESVDTASDILQSKNSDLEINTASPMINKVIKKTANQTTENLTLDKAILEEVKDKPLPKIIQPIGLIEKTMMKKLKILNFKLLAKIKIFISWCRATSLVWFPNTVSITIILQLPTLQSEKAPYKE
jgi:hypothetical protein